MTQNGSLEASTFTARFLSERTYEKSRCAPGSSEHIRLTNSNSIPGKIMSYTHAERIIIIIKKKERAEPTGTEGWG